MVIEGLDPVIISKLTSHQVEHVTCIECCKYYIAPETAACGHTLCHTCWKGRRACHTCAAPVAKKALKLNLPLQALTEHVHALADAFEKLFNVKLEEFTLDILDDLQQEDPTKHVKEWLANSDNQFSAPALSSQVSVAELQPHMELSKSKIQIHTPNNKTKSPDKVVKPPQSQEDWDKIEVLPDTEEVSKKPKENVIGPMDIEPFIFDDNDYSNENPRRSSRKKELEKKADCNPPSYDFSADKNSAKNSSTGTKSLKNKQTWNSVKKMRKEFSKLNKRNKSKLNVSIEMCKKAQSANKPKQAQTLPQPDSEKQHFVIDDNTPHVSNKEISNNKSTGDANENKEPQNSLEYDNPQYNKADVSTEELPDVFNKINSISNKQSGEMNQDILENNQMDVEIECGGKCKKKSSYDTTNLPAFNNSANTNLPFIKKGALRQITPPGKESDVLVTQKEVEADTLQTNTDNIEISIKIGNTVTNIVIKHKQNDVQIKTSTDKEIQTSLGPYSLVNKCDAGCSPINSVNVQTIELNIDENNKVAVNKTISSKKNTASADTATVPTARTQFEITDSIERELSDVMEHLERKRNRTDLTQKNTQSEKPAMSAKSSQITVKETNIPDKTDCIENNKNNDHKNYTLECDKESPEQPQKITQEVDIVNKDMKSQNKYTKEIEFVNKDMEVIEDLNDIDIFNSGSVKEANVNLLKDSDRVLLLKDTEKVASEILMPTIKSKKSQKVADKREREVNDDIELPCSKKQKTNSNDNTPQIEVISATAVEEQPKDVGNDSESMNYDAIMSQVFANIDADIHNSNNKKIGKTQVLKQKSNESENSAKGLPLQSSQIIQKTQNKVRNDISVVKTVPNLEEDNKKYSENVFSIVDKDSQAHEASGKNNKIPPPTDTQQHIDNLLTPGMCRDLAASENQDNNTQVEHDVDMVELIHATPVVDHDDSESVVEATPQKNISFTKPKQHNDASQCVNENQQTKQNLVPAKQPDNKETDSQIIRSIIDISDTTIESSKKDTTIVDMAKKKVSLSTNKDQVSETPLTINKFVNDIKHKSTPVARKSLHFDSEIADDPEQTLCPTTTQEKEFLSEAFKQTPISPIKRALTLKNIFNRPAKKLFVAGSCLSPAESKKLKMLCQERGWTYLDKYTTELTHLVVGVDEENKSQRSVKYMCALAASKWIVTYSWVEKCLQTKSVVDEFPYEALDACGEPGPRRSRTAIKKIFEGITFYCMPPFSLLDIDTLKQMLKAAGGCVAEDPDAVKLTNDKDNSKPKLLLVEPESTQEDKFVYFTMEHQVVPVNFEWALNCLGTYSLCSIRDLLLCPYSIVPPCVRSWPADMLRETEEEEE